MREGSMRARWVCAGAAALALGAFACSEDAATDGVGTGLDGGNAELGTLGDTRGGGVAAADGTTDVSLTRLADAVTPDSLEPAVDGVDDAPPAAVDTQPDVVADVV